MISKVQESVTVRSINALFRSKGYIFLELILSFFWLIRLVVFFSVKKSLTWKNLPLKSDSLASITKEGLDDNFENVALHTSCTSGPSYHN